MDPRTNVIFNIYGCDIDTFVSNVKESFTYNAGGVGMVIAGLMSDAQEEMLHQNIEGATQTLNRAKHLLFLALGGNLMFLALKGGLDFNRLTVEKIEE
jgi:hypothetical protein